MTETRQNKRRLNLAKIEIRIFTALMVVYYLLNVIFPTDLAQDADNSARIYPQLIGAILAGYSLLIAILSYRLVLKSRLNRLFVILLGWTFLYAFYPFSPAANIAFIIRSNMAIITMLAIFVMVLKIKDKRFWSTRIWILFAVQLLYCLFMLMTDKTAHDASNELHFDSNTGFMLITLIPLVLTIPAKRLRLYLYLLVAVACVYSGQRSAALSAVLSFPFCFSYLRQSIKKSDVVILLVLGAIVIAPIMVDAIQNLNERTQYDLSRDNLGSGRLIIWAIVINDFFSHGPIQILFGNGTFTVSRLLDRVYGMAIGAHNGWIDMTYTFGLAGLCLYATIIFSLLFRDRVVSRRMPEYRHLYLIIFVIFFTKSVTTHGNFDLSVIPLSTCLAMIEAGMLKKKGKASLYNRKKHVRAKKV